jgi:hypothetical protein
VCIFKTPQRDLEIHSCVSGLGSIETQVTCTKNKLRRPTSNRHTKEKKKGEYAAAAAMALFWLETNSEEEKISM